MNPFRLSLIPIILACLLMGGLPADAGSKKAKPQPPEDPRILVTAVDLTNKQITVIHKRSKQTDVYTIDDMTQVTLDNNPGSISDIKAGQQVFSYSERDAHTLDKIDVGTADSAPVTHK